MQRSNTPDVDMHESRKYYPTPAGAKIRFCEKKLGLELIYKGWSHVLLEIYQGNGGWNSGSSPSSS